MVDQPGQPVGMVGQLEDSEAQTLAVQRTALHEDICRPVAESQNLGHVVHHPSVGRSRGGQDRCAGG